MSVGGDHRYLIIPRWLTSDHRNVIISIGCIYKSLKSVPLIPTYNGLCDYT